MADPNEPEDDNDDPLYIPDEEEMFLEELGLGSDGTPMTLGDTAWNGMPWEPDSETGVN